MYKLSLILPVYNEERAIDRTVGAVCDFGRRNSDCECILVDDGSKDRTAEKIAIQLRSYTGGNIRFLSLGENQGKGRAVQQGFAVAQGAVLCFTDGDLAYSLDQVMSVYEGLRTHEVVIGSRNLPGSFDRVEPIRRKVLGSGFNLLARCITQLPYQDTQAGLKGFRAEAARRLFGSLHTSGFSFDVELLYLAKKFGYRVGEIPVQVSLDHNYKVSKLKLIRDSWRMLGGLIQIRLNDLTGKYGSLASRSA